MPLVGCSDCLPKSLHRGCQLGDLSQMHQRESSQRFPTAIGELNMHKRMASRVAPTCNQAGSLRAIDKTNNAVVAQHQRLRQLADRRPLGPAATPYREQQLMLRRGQTLLFGSLLAPVQEGRRPVRNCKSCSYCSWLRSSMIRTVYREPISYRDRSLAIRLISLSNVGPGTLVVFVNLLSYSGYYDVALRDVGLDERIDSTGGAA
jgi:hypothetical protein